MCIVPSVVQELSGDLQVSAGAFKRALVPTGLALEGGKQITCVNHVYTAVWCLVGEEVFEVGQRLDSVAPEVPVNCVTM